MSDKKVIEARIAELKGELERVEGRPTEVYSRIVGYYRSVRNWNAGKREEYGQRLVYRMPEAELAPAPAREAAQPRAEVERQPAPAHGPQRPAGLVMPQEASVRDGVLVFTREAQASRGLESQDSLLVFTREACPNCSPVANYVIASGIKAVFVDVDRDEGLALARDYGVMATPTILGLDGEGREAFRAFDVKGLSSRLGEARPEHVAAQA